MAIDKPKAHALHYRRSLSHRAEGADPFRPLEPECQVVQFSQPLGDSELRRAGSLLAGRPDIQLYVYGNASRDLDFLSHFPGLKRLQLALYGLEDASGIANVAGSLEEFRFGPTKKTFSLQFLDAMPALRGLFLAGHKKDLAAVQAAGGIRELGLSMITLPDLRVILPLSELSALSIILGGTRDLALLPKFRRLEKLMLMRITKMSDLGVLAELTGLKKLHLDWMRNITTLPSLAPLARLKRVRLDTMKGLTDLAPVAAAPALRELSVTNMPQLKAENFRCLIGHPHLERLWAYVGRQKVNEEIKRLLPAVAQ